MTLSLPELTGEETVLEIARIMAKSGVSAVPIMAPDGSVAAVVTHADVAIALGHGHDPATTRAVDIAPGSIMVSPDADLEETAKLLLENRGLGVVADNGTVVGIIEVWQIEKYFDALDALGPNATDLITEVAPQDFASRQWRGANLEAGASAVECIRDAMAAAGKHTVTNLLDFPCGYGRILRALKVAFPEARLTACDIDREAVDFCARVFDAMPIYSWQKPEAVEIDDRFDLIWCGSLLTHVNSDRWPGFLALFRRCLAPDGLLVLTASGRHLRARHVVQTLSLTGDQVDRLIGDYDRNGFGYGDYPESQDYGIAVASPEWVGKRLDEAGLRLIKHSELAWYAPAPRQDVYVCVAA